MSFIGVQGALRRARSWGILSILVFGFAPGLCLAGANVTLAWDPSTDATAAGYHVYYGVGSRTYTNVIDTATNTSLIITGLVSGVTYYFAATTYNLAGLESDYSTEAFYAVPSPVVNLPPTLNQPADLTINENSGPQTVTLTGISSGSPAEIQTLTVTAFSSNAGLVPAPVINYTSPNSTAVLTLAPVAGSYGSSTVTVMVDDGGAVSNTVIRSFSVMVLPVNNFPTLDPLSSITIQENAGVQTVNLSGITAGAGETQTLTVTASSSNPALIPGPSVQYVSPNTTGTLTFMPATNAYGSTQLTVTVDDGQPTNNLFTGSFVVTVLSNSGITNIPSTSWALWWQHTSGLTTYWQMDGTNQVKGARLNVVPVDPSWRLAGQADFNGDGQTDLLWQHTSGLVGIWLMNDTNCIGHVRVGSGPVSTGWRIGGTGDVDGDGIADIIWQHTSGLTAVWFMDGTNCTRGSVLNAPLAGTGWRLAGTGHFGSSGKTDLLWQYSTGATSVWLMDGTNCTSHFLLNVPAAGTGLRIVGVADITGVGHSDIVWENDVTGELSYWLMDGVNRVGMGRLNPGRVDPSWRAMGPR